MNTQFLESFLLVVEHGSLTEVARRLNLTPAAVAQRLRAIENELGIALVSRSGRTVKPTEAGWAILPLAHTLLSGVRDLRITATTKNLAGDLRLGGITSALTGMLPPIMSGLAVKYPLMSLFICPGSSTDLYSKVVEAKLDAAVIVEPDFPIPKTCEWETWREEPLIVLAHDGVNETDAHKILETQPFIRHDRKQWGGRLADSYLQRFGLCPHVRFDLDSLEAIAVLVDRRLGISLVPDWARPWPEGLALRKIGLPRAYERRRIGLLWRRSSACGHLVEILLREASLHASTNFRMLCTEGSCNSTRASRPGPEEHRSRAIGVRLKLNGKRLGVKSTKVGLTPAQ